MTKSETLSELEYILPSINAASAFKTEHLEQGGLWNNRGVAVDMDGVLIDGMQFHIEAWKRAFSIHGIELPVIEIYKWEGMKSSDVVERVCSKMDISLSNSKKNEIVHVKRRIYEDILRVVPIPESTTLIKRLHSYGYTLALVTGTSKRAAERTLSELNIKKYFSHIVTSETVNKGKPFPEPYLRALSMFDINAKNCIAIENSPPGIKSAKSAGLLCIAIAKYLPVEFLSEADKVFENIERSIEWFEFEFRESKGQGEWIL